MPLPQRYPLTSPDPVHRDLENQVEKISDTLADIDGFLYRSKYDAAQMQQFFRSLASRANACAETLKDADTG